MFLLTKHPKSMQQIYELDTFAYDILGHMSRICTKYAALRWRHNGRDSVSNLQPHDCLLNRLFRRRSTKTSKLRVTGLCAGNSPATGEFPTQMASNAVNVSIWWRHHGMTSCQWTTMTATIPSFVIRDIYTRQWTAPLPPSWIFNEPSIPVLTSWIGTKFTLTLPSLVAW